MSDHFFFDGGLLATCVSADAATRFTATDDFGFCSSFPAVDATFADVVSPPDFLVAMGAPVVGCEVEGLPFSSLQGRPPITAEDEANEAARLQMIAAHNAAAIHSYSRSPATREYGAAWQERNS